MIREYKKEKIFKYLGQATEPLDIEKIRRACGIGNWNTALNYCLTLLIEGKIKGQKTSKSWVFWTHQETQLKPWEEAIGTYKALKVNENNVTLTLTHTLKNLKITFPKNTPEANTLINTLQNTQKGQKIAILKTDNPQKPLIIKTLKEATAAHKSGLRRLWVRSSILWVAFKDFRLVALRFSLLRFELRSWRLLYA